MLGYYRSLSASVIWSTILFAEIANNKFYLLHFHIIMSQRSYIVSGQHTFFHSTLHPLPLSVLYCFINLLLRKKMVLFLFYLLQTVIFYASHFVLVWSAGKITNGTYSQFFFIPSFYASNMRNEASVKIRAVHFNVYLSEIIVVNIRNGELVKILCA